jgi:hypothetical protein
VSSVPGIGERVQPSADIGAGTGTAYFVDNGRLGVLVRLELYPDKDGPDFHFLGHELQQPSNGPPHPRETGVRNRSPEEALEKVQHSSTSDHSRALVQKSLLLARHGRASPLSAPLPKIKLTGSRARRRKRELIACIQAGIPVKN